MLTLIGSRAAKKHFPDFREPKDVDFHTADKSQADGFMQAFRDNGDAPPDVFVEPRLAQWNWGPVATPSELYTMKVSHSFWEIHRDVRNWNKHMADVIFFQRKGVKFDRELYDILKPIMRDLHEPKRTSLAQNKQNFFADAVKRKYDHDSIHDSIAYGDHPLYEDILVPGEEVMVDSKRFFEGMDHETKLKCVREEVYATALERILIPNNYKGSPGAAYAWALRRTITSLFKGEWALWTVLNYDTLSRPDCNYLQRHLDNADKLILLEDA